MFFVFGNSEVKSSKFIFSEGKKLLFGTIL